MDLPHRPPRLCSVPDCRAKDGSNCYAYRYRGKDKRLEQYLGQACCKLAGSLPGAMVAEIRFLDGHKVLAASSAAVRPKL